MHKYNQTIFLLYTAIPEEIIQQWAGQQDDQDKLRDIGELLSIKQIFLDPDVRLNI